MYCQCGWWTESDQCISVVMEAQEVYSQADEKRIDGPNVQRVKTQC